MDKRGQAMVEYVILLVAFTTAAVAGWRVIKLPIASLYTRVSEHRAGLEGMRP
jgi:Flp pilus assembly pilin Flp